MNVECNRPRMKPATLMSFAAMILLVVLVSLLPNRALHAAPEPQVSGNQGKGDERREGGGSDKDKPPYQITADKKEKVGNEYEIASGYVDILYEGMRIQADWIKFNLLTHEIHAKGNILFDTGDQFITANEAILDLKTQRGKFYHAQGVTENKIHFTGERIDKVGEDTYKIYTGTFTSCTQATPIWRFTCKEATLNLEDYALLKNPIMQFKKFPTFFSPYLILPLEEDDRQTGFLFPVFGMSSLHGAFFSNAFFWAINRSMDATFYADYYTRLGFGGGADFRYVYDAFSRGNADFYVLSPEEHGQATWKIFGEMTHRFSEGMEFRGSANFFNSLAFIEEFEQDFDRVTLRSRNFQGFFTRDWSYYTLNVMADWVETYFYGFEGDSIIRSHKPEIQFSGRSKKFLNSPFYYSFNSSYGFLRDERSGANFHRADVFPRVSMPINSIPWLQVDPSIAGRYTFYTQQYAFDEFGNIDFNKILDKNIDRKYLNADVKIIGPSFSKVYEKGGKFYSQKFKHIIEPRLTYTYISDFSNFDKIIRFDYVEAVSPLNEIKYGLINRFFAKRKTKGAKKPMPWEFLTIELGQMYSLDPTLRTSYGSQYNRFTGGFIPGSAANRLSPLQLSIKSNPVGEYRFGFEVDYDLYYGVFSEYNINGSIGREGDPWYFGAAWFRSVPLEPGRIAASQLGARGGVKIFKDTINFDYVLRYDIMRHNMQEGFFRLMYKTQCCSVAVELRRFNFNFRRENRIAIIINLLNVGSFGSQFGESGFTQERGGFYY